jgi:hypothetical protein
MPDAAQINRSISTVRTELEFLRDSGALLPQQLDSILAQLPQNGQQSSYIDPRYGSQQWGPSPQVFNQVSAAAQNPQSPANPDHPKVSGFLCEMAWMRLMTGTQHHEWAKGMAGKFGNAMMWGAGATLAGDIVNDVMHHV